LSVRPSPNIWNTPELYELENRAADPGDRIATAMREIGDWAGRTVLDVGCGSGFHLPRWAASAAQVVGVEPHPPLVALARRRTRSLAHVRVLDGGAQALPLPDASVDVAHARWAYFFGPGCDPGLAEIDRVLRRGGAAFVIDNDARTSTFGRWFSWEHPDYDTDAVDAFFGARGWVTEPVAMRWSFGSRADLEAVVRIEFSPEVADRIIAEHEGTEVDYAIVIRHLTR
jgi:ubiquinone/menaquinone biosynthesis C-methylase UbiE